MEPRDSPPLKSDSTGTETTKGVEHSAKDDLLNTFIDIASTTSATTETLSTDKNNCPDNTTEITVTQNTEQQTESPHECPSAISNMLDNVVITIESPHYTQMVANSSAAEATGVVATTNNAQNSLNKSSGNTTTATNPMEQFHVLAQKEVLSPLFHGGSSGSGGTTITPSPAIFSSQSPVLLSQPRHLNTSRQPQPQPQPPPSPLSQQKKGGKQRDKKEGGLSLLSSSQSSSPRPPPISAFDKEHRPPKKSAISVAMPPLLNQTTRLEHKLDLSVTETVLLAPPPMPSSESIDAGLRMLIRADKLERDGDDNSSPLMGHALADEDIAAMTAAAEQMQRLAEGGHGHRVRDVKAEGTAGAESILSPTPTALLSESPFSGDEMGTGTAAAETVGTSTMPTATTTVSPKVMNKEKETSERAKENEEGGEMETEAEVEEEESEEDKESELDKKVMETTTTTTTPKRIKTGGGAEQQQQQQQKKKSATFPLRVNKWLCINSLGEIPENEADIVVIPYARKKSRTVNVLWPIGFKSTRRHTNYLQGNICTYVCSTAQNAAWGIEFRIANEFDPENPIVERTPSAAVAELNTRMLDVTKKMRKYIRFSSPVLFFGLGYEEVRALITKLPNYPNDLTKYIRPNTDNDQHGEEDENILEDERGHRSEGSKDKVPEEVKMEETVVASGNVVAEATENATQRVHDSQTSTEGTSNGSGNNSKEEEEERGGEGDDVDDDDDSVTETDSDTEHVLASKPKPKVKEIVVEDGGDILNPHYLRSKTRRPQQQQQVSHQQPPQKRVKKCTGISVEALRKLQQVREEQIAAFESIISNAQKAVLGLQRVNEEWLRIDGSRVSMLIDPNNNNSNGEDLGDDNSEHEDSYDKAHTGGTKDKTQQKSKPKPKSRPKPKKKR